MREVQCSGDHLSDSHVAVLLKFGFLFYFGRFRPHKARDLALLRLFSIWLGVQDAQRWDFDPQGLFIFIIFVRGEVLAMRSFVVVQTEVPLDTF